ncbi:hypothetical protein [Amycolatopsis japonica]|uniref:hypothetical protein n=1 Tax=Amycolatopsis japonica TaxID=208439 RepID=UPI003822FD72
MRSLLDQRLDLRIVIVNEEEEEEGDDGFESGQDPDRKSPTPSTPGKWTSDGVEEEE